MFKQFDKNAQGQIDLRLTSEKTFQENIADMVEFAAAVREDMTGKYRMIRSKQEGYGYLAQLYATAAAHMKSVKDGMTKLLTMLGGNEDECADQAASIFNSCQDVVENALLMAAEAKKVSQDLYALAVVAGEPMTPIDEAIAKQEYLDSQKEAELEDTTDNSDGREQNTELSPSEKLSDDEDLDEGLGEALDDALQEE